MNFTEYPHNPVVAQVTSHLVDHSDLMLMLVVSSVPFSVQRSASRGP